MSVPGGTSLAASVAGSLLDPDGAGAPAMFEFQARPLGPGDLTVLSFRGREAISKLFSFDLLVLAGPAHERLETLLLEQPGAVALQVSGRAPRVARGIVVAAERLGVLLADRGHVYRLRLAPRLWLLKRRATSRIFQDRAVPDVVSSVLGALGIASVWKLAREHPRRAYCVQYQETDFAFVKRLLAEEGIFFYFEHPAGPLDGPAGAWELGERVVFSDDARFYPSIDDASPLDAAGVASPPGASARLRLRDDDARLLSDDDDVGRFGRRATVRSNRVLLRDYDFRRPLLNLRSEAVADGDGIGAVVAAESPSGPAAAAVPGADGAATDLGIYRHRGDYAEHEVSGARSRMDLEQHRRRRVVAAGASSCRRLLPGHAFLLEADAGPLLSGTYVVTRVEHEGYTPEFVRVAPAVGEEVPPGLGMAQSYSNRFECVPSDVAFRPRRPDAVVRQVMESATVVGPAGEEIYTDEHGRIKVQFHWDLDGSRDEGSSCWIRVVQGWAGPSWGTQFVPRVGMEVVVGFLGGDQDCPVVTGCLYNGLNPPPFALPAEKTRSGIRTRSAPFGSAHNELSFEDATGEEQVYLHAAKNLDAAVEHDHTVVVGHDEEVTIKNDRRHTVVGDETARVAGARSETVQRDHVTLVEGNRNETVLQDRMSWVDGNSFETVSGDATRSVTSDLTTHVGGAERREVAGLQDIRVSDDLTVRVRGCHVVLVGRHDAKRSYLLHVEGTTQLSGSGLTEVVSEKGIVLRCGESTIRLGPKNIELSAPEVLVKGKDALVSVGDGKAKVVARADALVSGDRTKVVSNGAGLVLDAEAKVVGSKVHLKSGSEASEQLQAQPATPPTTIELVDQDGKPVPHARYVVLLGDGSEQSGVVDEGGKAEIEIEGAARVLFPDLGEVKPA